MKTITRSRIYLPMAAIILTAGLAIPAAAQQQVPFRYLPRKGRRQPTNDRYKQGDQLRRHGRTGGIAGNRACATNLFTRSML